MKNVLASVLCLMALQGCSQQIKDIGVAPAFSPVQIGTEYADLSADAYPPAPNAPPQFSLWRDERSNFFSDRRAYLEGDILTVLISIDDEANFKNKSERDRSTSRKMGLAGNYSVDGVGGTGSADGDLSSTSDFQGNGAIARSETIRLSVAAVVQKRLPNGNLLIRGSQEIRVNAELRILNIAGIVRPTDISPTNTVPYERIAEARISYGGRGRLSEVQQPPYGAQLLDIISPF